MKSICKQATRRLAPGIAAMALALGALAGCGGADDLEIAGLRLIGDYAIPTGQLFDGVEFGGISGIDRAPDGSYWAISDDRGGERGAPRFYALSIDLDATGLHSVDIRRMAYLQGPDGQRLPSTARTVDPEGIRQAPNGHLYISSEGNYSSPTQRDQPFVREFTTDGRFVRAFQTPAAFDYVDSATTGGRSNKLFEALAVTPNGTLLTANEDALVQDGPLSSLTAGSVVRVLQLDAASGRSTAQYAYPLPRIPVDQAVTGSFPPDNGLAELLAVTDNRFIAVERAYADGVGNTIRLVLATIHADTTDVQHLASLVGADFQPVRRELLLEMPITWQGVKLDNIEGIAWGPRLANGHRTLVLVADNNFSGKQRTQFIALEVLPR